jgi:dihydrolipoamide dehydrogenase
VDYYPEVAEFTAPYTLSVAGQIITAQKIFLCTGSRPAVPSVEGLAEAGYLTSDTLLSLKKLPKSLVIIGGGYIAAEYGHFFAAMGSRVTIIGRNPQFIPEEEPEISAAAVRELGRHLTILTNHEVRRVEVRPRSGKKVVAFNRTEGREVEITAEEILVASGRSPNSDLLHPERSGIATDDKGWIVVNEYMETTQPGVWALGDADGKYLFKHVANHEAAIVYYNAILGKRIPVDYHAVPHAVFTAPEIAGVGIREKEAVERYGKDGIRIGFHRYEETTKGTAIAAENAFVKVIIEASTNRILGAHIIGPDASILIQEIVTVLYTSDATIRPVIRAMHIHPALSEVVQRACLAPVHPDHYHEMLRKYGFSPDS